MRCFNLPGERLYLVLVAILLVVALLVPALRSAGLWLERAEIYPIMDGCMRLPSGPQTVPNGTRINGCTCRDGWLWCTQAAALEFGH